MKVAEIKNIIPEEIDHLHASDVFTTTEFENLPLGTRDCPLCKKIILS